MTTDIDVLIEAIEALKKFGQGGTVPDPYNKPYTMNVMVYIEHNSDELLTILQEYKGLKEERDKLKTVMMAAAVEIAEHWKDHCDKDGYGPVNLLRRLQKGLTGGGYAYTADDWIRLRTHNLALVGALEKWRDFIAEQPIGVFGIGSNGELDWPIRDEVIDSITKVLSNPDIQKYSRLLDAVDNCIKQGPTRCTQDSPWYELKEAYQALQERNDGS